MRFQTISLSVVLAAFFVGGCSHEPQVTDPADLTVALPPNTRIVQVEEDTYRPQVLQPDPAEVQAAQGKVYHAGRTVDRDGMVVDSHGFVRIEETPGPQTQAAGKRLPSGGTPITREPEPITDELALELQRTRAELAEAKAVTGELLERTERLMQATLEMRRQANALAQRTLEFEKAMNQEGAPTSDGSGSIVDPDLEL